MSGVIIIDLFEILEVEKNFYENFYKFRYK